jgi:putative phosphoribosyl transferase
MSGRFHNRHDAGRALGAALSDYAGRTDTFVLALPRGGVPVGAEVARVIGAPLDIVLVRKLGVPGSEELAFGAIASGGFRVLNPDVVSMACLSQGETDELAAREQRELERREQAYRGDRPLPDLVGKTVLLVDDGVATGASIRVAIRAVRARGAARVVVAVPVGAASTLHDLAAEAEDVVAVLAPHYLRAIGEWYDDFSQLTDEEVCALLAGRS